MRPQNTDAFVGRTRDELLPRNRIFETFFEAEARHEMSLRSLSGGRLLAFGNGSTATDAQQASVKFVHRVIVGKRLTMLSRAP